MNTYEETLEKKMKEFGKTKTFSSFINYLYCSKDKSNRESNIKFANENFEKLYSESKPMTRNDIFWNNKFDEDFLDKHFHLFDFREMYPVGYSQKFSSKFIIKHLEKILHSNCLNVFINGLENLEEEDAKTIFHRTCEIVLVNAKEKFHNNYVEPIFGALCEKTLFSEEYLEKYLEKYSDPNGVISRTQNLSEEFMNKHFASLHIHALLAYQKYSIDFIKSHLQEILPIYKNNKLSIYQNTNFTRSDKIKIGKLFKLYGELT